MWLAGGTVGILWYHNLLNDFPSKHQEKFGRSGRRLVSPYESEFIWETRPYILQFFKPRILSIDHKELNYLFDVRICWL